MRHSGDPSSSSGSGWTCASGSGATIAPTLERKGKECKGLYYFMVLVISFLPWDKGDIVDVDSLAFLD